MTDLLVCKSCNAPLNTDAAKNGVVECDFCHNRNTLPKSGQKQEVLTFLRMGENELNNCAFERAYTAFSKAIELDEAEPEGYFGRALARFCVQYLRDIENKEDEGAKEKYRMQPICHEISDKVFSQDADYQKALQTATPEQRIVYESRGKEIDYIRKEFFALRQKGLSYDCFICVKVTEEDKKTPTADSYTAIRLYNELKRNGYRPFFSEEEKGTRTGADYEAMILYALRSAPCMLIVCSEEKYLETKWVKSEYSRFLSLIREEEKERNSIAIVYRGKPIERLPGRNGKMQGIDFNEGFAVQYIRDFIDGHDAEKQRKKREQDEAERAAKERAAKEEENRRREAAERERAAAERAAKEREEAERRRAEEAEKRASEMEKRLKELEELAKRGAAEAAPAVKQAPAPAKQAAKPVSPAPAVRQAPAPAKQAAKPVSPAPAPAKQANPVSDFQIKDGVLLKYTGNGGDVVIPEGVKEIGEQAFSYCKTLTSVIISEGVTKIDSFAFSHCNSLTSVVIPAGVSNVDKGAFSDCVKLKEVKVNEKNKNYRVKNNCLIDVRTNTVVSGWGTNIVIPEGITKIGSFAFYGYKSLTSIVIPEGVTEIGGYAFEGCKSLTSVVIPEGVTKILWNAFTYCESLTNIVIPQGVAEIGGNAFVGCIALKKVTIPASVEKIGGWVFGYVGALNGKYYDVEITVQDEEPLSGKKPRWDSAWKGEKAKVIWQGKRVATPSAADLVSSAPAVRQQPAKQAPSPVRQASPYSDFEIKDWVLIKYGSVTTNG